jgi:hypothetical protein
MKVDGRHSFTLLPVRVGPTQLQRSATFAGILLPFAGSGAGAPKEGS